MNKIILNKNNLIYSVETILYKISKLEENIDKKIELQSDEDDDVITLNAIDSSINNIVSRLSAYVVANDESFIDLEFPEGWKSCLISELNTSIYNYIVYNSIYEFLRVVDNSQAEKYLDKANVEYRRIKSCITARGMMKRPLSPY